MTEPTERERCEKMLERMRNQPPKHRAEIYDCERCKNIGMLYSLTEWETPSGSTAYDVAQKECSCMNIRRAIAEMGVDFRKYSFERFETEKPWQAKMKTRVQEFVANDKAKMLFVGGKTGSGKTHLCTAAFAELLKTHNGKYISWSETIRRLKAVTLDQEAFYDIMRPLQTAEILYIDDFFKPVNGGNGWATAATEADIKIAFELLNYRYNKGSRTMMSTECYIADIMRIDEALGGRIAEMATERYLLQIEDKPENNYRRKSVSYL